MQIFNQITSKVLAYLSENQYCQTIISSNRNCFKMLGAYLEKKGVDYSPEYADEWFTDCTDSFSCTSKNYYKMALLRLHDVFEYDQIQLSHDTKHLKSYTILIDSLKSSLDEFLFSLEGSFAPETICKHKQAGARFLVYIHVNFQYKGLNIQYFRLFFITVRFAWPSRFTFILASLRSAGTTLYFLVFTSFRPARTFLNS